MTVQGTILTSWRQEAGLRTALLMARCLAQVFEVLQTLMCTYALLLTLETTGTIE